MKNKTWKVEIRDDCRVCGKPLPNSRYRCFCSKKCRTFANNQKQKQYISEWHKANKLKAKN